MKKKILFSLLISCMLFLNAIKAQNVEWAKSEPYASFVSWPNVIIRDYSGNIYSSGQSSSRVFVIKYTADGSMIWEKYYGGYNAVNGMCTDGSGNLYVSMMISVITINGIQYSENNGGGYLFIKYDSNGNVLWLKQMKLWMYLSDKMDIQGNLIVTGGFADTVYLDNGIILLAPPPRRTSLFIATFNQNGECVWAIQDDGAQFSSLKINNNGELFACDWFNSSSITLGQGINQVTFNSADGGSYCAKYNNNGELMWAKQVNTSLIAPDEFGNAYTLELDNSYTNTGFVTKYDTSGNLLWKRTSIYVHYGYKMQMHCGSNGDIYLSGGFKNYMSIDDSIINGGPDYRMFIAKIDSSGTLKWITTSSGTGGAGAKDLTVSGNEIFITGDMGGENTFGDYTVNEPLGGVFTLKITDDEMQPFSVNEITSSKSELNVYPNPSGNLINIQCSGLFCKTLSINVKNNLSQIIYSTTASNITNEYRTTIDLSNQPKGIYFIEIIADRKREVKKLVLH